MGECLSCGRDLMGSLPRLPVADPSALLDAELVVLWRFWSQTHHFTGGLQPDPDFILKFRAWLKEGRIEEPVPPQFAPWEVEFLADFRAGDPP